MRVIHPIARTYIILISILFPGCAFAQTAADQIGLITSALQNQDFARALVLLRPALQQSPRNAQLWTMQGVAYAGDGQQNEAVASFRRALAISPDYLPALEGAIQIEYESGSKEAIPLLQHVLRLRPADRTSHGMLAVLEYQQENCAAAVVHFEKAGELFDTQPSALHAYAACLVKLKQFDKAAEVSRRTLALTPRGRARTAPAGCAPVDGSPAERRAFYFATDAAGRQSGCREPGTGGYCI